MSSSHNSSHNRRKRKNRIHIIIIAVCILCLVVLGIIIYQNPKIPAAEHDPNQSLTPILTPTLTDSEVLTPTGELTQAPVLTGSESNLPTETGKDPINDQNNPTPSAVPTATAVPTPSPEPTATPVILPGEASSGTGIEWTDSTHTYLYFGSYPQSEVTGSDLTNEIIHADYDYNGDTEVNGIRYRRLSVDMINYNYYADNTTLVKNYFDWSEGGYHYFKYEPIKWRVLKLYEDEVFVITAEALDCKCYNEEDAYVTWEVCSVRSWLNGYDENCNDCGIDYSWRNAGFLSLAFSEAERNLINYTLLSDNGNVDYPDITGGSDTVDRIFFLSLNDITNTDYGYSSKLMDYDQKRIVTSSTYAKARGLYSYYASRSICHGAPSWYWLRTPGMDLDYTAVISNIALALSNGLRVTQPDAAILPAMRISLTKSNNEAEFTASATEVPVFSGVHDRTVEIGKAIAYRKGVTASDAQDGTLDFTVDSSSVNYRVAGSYTVIYTASDSDGNITTKSAVFTVTSPVNMEAQVEALLNQVIASIITVNMSGYEKTRAIYNYVKNHVGYIGTSNKEDSLLDAYIGLKNGIGDCYTTFNVAKRLLDKAGIDNLPIERLRYENESRHYWLLVNYGEGWYYFDAGYFSTNYPFDGFLFTESERIAYNDLRGGFYYRYNTSLYDVTPVW